MNNTDRNTVTHIDGKFVTESEPITLQQYFNQFKNAINNFEKECEVNYKFPPGIKNKTRPELVNYVGNPATFIFKPEEANKGYYNLWKRSVNQTSYNNNLKTVSCKEPLLFPKYASHHFLSNENSVDITSEKKNSKIILSFRVYRPFLSDGRAEDVKLQQEILLRGNQTLKQLEDAIECNLDYCGLEDLSNTPDDYKDWTMIKKEKLRYPLAFFFINNTFYSNGSNVLSNVPKKFLEANGMGPYKVKTFNDQLQLMQLQLGRPYVYQHIGQCEHLIVISDARLQTKDDAADYPFHRCISGVYPRLCIICSTIYAKWLVVNCGKLPTARSFMCHRCFQSYCYIDNRKVDDFKAYQYLDLAVIL